jgi:prevent-host-death family protein
MVLADERKDESPALLEVTASDAARQFGDLMNRIIAGERVIITRHGKPLAALITARDLARLDSAA